MSSTFLFSALLSLDMGLPIKKSAEVFTSNHSDSHLISGIFVDTLMTYMCSRGTELSLLDLLLF